MYQPTSDQEWEDLLQDAEDVLHDVQEAAFDYFGFEPGKHLLVWFAVKHYSPK